ncbi:transcriptional regulator [Deinococcus navajonensis]|uniref:Transcriptional regulator n=1 Tax=Deinococcus navajonensis TaxID=309884 RepID=A0ABV8XSR6_9DEIO
MVGRARRAWVTLAALLCPQAAAADVDELLTALKRARMLAVRGQAEVTVNFPPRPEPSRRAAQLPAVPVLPGLLARNFSVVRGGTDTVAGRAATRYDLTPHNVGAGRWTLWVDLVWRLPLAFEERRPGGELARRATFLKVNAALAKVSRPVALPPAGLRAALLQALPGLRLPDGFTPVDVKKQGERWTVTLSDGINVLVLVTAPRGVQAAPGVTSRPVAGSFVWLVGNLPQEALDSALSGVHQVRPARLGTFLTAADSNP